MFRALICSSSGGTVYTTIGILFVLITHKKLYQLYIQYLLMMSKYVLETCRGY
jgi:hypothetical protein